jgi:hypothetical protein
LVLAQPCAPIKKMMPDIIRHFENKERAEGMGCFGNSFLAGYVEQSDLKHFGILSIS